MSAFKYLFYRLYLWQVACWKDDKVSINALLLVVVLLWMNLITLVGLAESIWREPLLLFRFSRVGTLMCMLLIAVPLYFTLVHKNRYERVVKEFEAESPRQRRTRGLGVSLYVMFSVVLLFAVALLHGKAVSG
jgi:polyferredoxin